MAWPHLLLLLTAPALMLAENSKAENKTMPGENALHDTNNTTTTTLEPLPFSSLPTPTKSPHKSQLCNETQKKHVNEVSKDERKCLKQFLLSQAIDRIEPTCNSIESVNNSLTRVFNAYATCLEEKRRSILFSARETFLTVLNFSVKGGNFEEIIGNGFVKCINKTIDNIRRCVTEGTGIQKYKPRLRLTQLTTLELSQKGCSQSKKIRNCVEETLKGQATLCSTTLVNYVDSLFNFTSRQCTLPFYSTRSNIVSAKMHPGVIAAIVILPIGIIIIVVVFIKKRKERKASD